MYLFVVLEFDQIKEYIKKPRNSHHLAEAVKRHKLLNMLVNGDDVEHYLSKVDNYENQEKLELRKKFAKSTRHIYSAALTPVDKIFSAKGGSIFYNLPDSQRAIIDSRIRQNLKTSIKKWIQKFIVNPFTVDPNGLIFIEYNNEQVYPTYKSSETIHDILTDEETIEYVIFKYGEDEDKNKLYRVVDDAFDYLILHKDDQFTIIREQTFINPFGKVPGRVISDIPDPNEPYMMSFIEDSVELGLEAIRDLSIKNIFKVLHGYPIFWKYLEECKVCNGTKYVDGEPCPSCQGTGFNMTKDVSDVIGVRKPIGDEQRIAPDLAGYIQPSVETWKQMNVDIALQKAAIEYTLWGSHTKESAGNETATGRFIDQQPVNDRLNKLSDSFENIHKFILDFCVRYYIQNYRGSGVNYGRRFIIETPDKILERYNSARTSGSPEAVLNYLLIQFYQAEFENDEISMQKYLKLMKIEPFVHFDVNLLKSIQITNFEMNKKLYFSQWMQTLSDNEIITTDSNTLQQSLNDYTLTKINENEKV